MPVSNTNCHRVLQSRLAWLCGGLWSFLLLCRVEGADGDFAGGRIRLLFSVEAEGGGAVCLLPTSSLSRVPNITVYRVINGPAKATLTKFTVQRFGHSFFPLFYTLKKNQNNR